MNFEIRYAVHPEDMKSYDTTRIRKEFLIEKVMIPGEVTMVYSFYDRYIVGGIVPTNAPIKLEAHDELKAAYFLERREMGIVNVGGDAKIVADGTEYILKYKEALYLGRGIKDVVFESADASKPAHLYMNSAPAHKELPSRHVTLPMPMYCNWVVWRLRMSDKLINCWSKR